MEKENIIKQVLFLLMGSIFNQENPEQLCFTTIIILLVVLMTLMFGKF